MKQARAAILLILLLLPAALRDGVPAAHAEGVLKVAFLDIGQGDAIYIEAPNGRQMIIDGGPESNILEPLSQQMPFGDRSIDVLMVTNPDADHYSGFLDVIKEYSIGALVEPGTVSKTPTYAALEREIVEAGMPHMLARKGMKIILDQEHGVVFDVLFPDQDVSGWTTNDGSLVGVLSYGSTRVMFTGDGTTTTENAVMLRTDKEVLKSDILKVGHHGSRTSTGDAFVQAVAPKYAVISDGRNNRYKHPHQETLDTLARHDVDVHRTDLEGTVVFISDGATFTLIR